MKYIFRVFSNSCGYSFLIRHQKLTDGNFLKVSCHAESKTINELFIFCYVKIRWSALHINWIYYQSMIS